MIFQHRTGQFDLSRRTAIVGIVNVTPDSFSDGGRFFGTNDAIAHALTLVEHGADILDVGGESTRPGAAPVPAEEETRRIVPVIEGILRQTNTPISIDTYKAAVASAAIQAGASIVNDISSFQSDPAMAEVVVQTGAGVFLMHMQGRPRTMQNNPAYADVVVEVKNYLRERIEGAISLGISRNRLMVDPGIGFGKTTEHNLELLRRLGEFKQLQCPILVGTSRKSFIAIVLGAEKADRDWATAGTVACCVAQGAHAVRVHNVSLCSQVARMTDAVLHGVAER